MSNKQDKRRDKKQYKVYYFKGDYFSSEGERRYYTYVKASSEHEAEKLFKTLYPNCNFGWIDVI